MDGKSLLGLLAEYIQIISFECDRIGSVDAAFDERYIKQEHIRTPAARCLGVVAEHKGAARSRTKVGGDGDFAIVGLAQQGQYDIDPSVRYPGYIALLIGSVHAVV